MAGSASASPRMSGTASATGRRASTATKRQTISGEEKHLFNSSFKPRIESTLLVERLRTQILQTSRISPIAKYTLATPTFLLPEAFTLLGKRIDFTLIVVDEKSCDKEDGATVDSCNTHTQRVSVLVPDRKPALSVTLNKVPVKPTGHGAPRAPLRVGESNDLVVRVQDQYADCSLSIIPDIPLGTDKQTASVTKDFPFAGFPIPLTPEPVSCFSFKPWTQPFTINLPGDVAHSIPFTLVVNTSFPKTKGKSFKPDVVARYPFQIGPERRVIVDGPTQGLTLKKTIDISCQDVTCNGFTVAYLDDPLQCRPGGKLNDQTIKFDPIDSLERYGGSKEARWRFTLKDEQENGEYVCIKASTNSGDIYSLGLSNGLPTRVSIDATPPDLTLSFTLTNSFTDVLKMRCADPTGPSGKAYTSGCKDRPYSYAYVTDPLSFATRILTGSTGGFLGSGWHGCPNPETGYWITYNSDEEEMEYLDSAVKVICVKATDNAGNSVVKSKLLYSSQEMLALFLRGLAKKGVI